MAAERLEQDRSRRAMKQRQETAAQSAADLVELSAVFETGSGHDGPAAVVMSTGNPRATKK